MRDKHVLTFAEAGRSLGAAAKSLGLVAPSFRTPPRLEGTDRSIRRGAEGSALVSVRSRGRVWAAVVADMIEGVVVANRLDAADAARTRDELWQAAESIATLQSRPARPVALARPAPAEVPRAA